MTGKLVTTGSTDAFKHVAQTSLMKNDTSLSYDRCIKTEPAPPPAGVRHQKKLNRHQKKLDRRIKKKPKISIKKKLKHENKHQKKTSTKISINPRSLSPAFATTAFVPGSKKSGGSRGAQPPGGGGGGLGGGAPPPNSSSLKTCCICFTSNDFVRLLFLCAFRRRD